MATILRWVCGKCSKKWIYPVDKCAYCKGAIKKEKGTKLKVIGITKVTIPSPMHPIVPYNILLLEDEHGNKMPKKTMEDYKIGEPYVEEKAKENGAVAIVKVKYDIYEAIKESLELLNDFSLADEKVLVKPSIAASAYPYQAVNTNPEFLDALLKVLYDYGIKKENILVAEQALIGTDVMDAASKAGILDVCKKHEIPFADISKGPFDEIEADGYKFSIFREALQRKIINCPVMKTNFQLGISGALENLIRLTDETTQRSMYYDNIETTLPKLARTLKMLNIGDATSGMHGQGPLSLGEPAFLNLVYSSTNPFNIDAAFCEAGMLPMPRYINAQKFEVAGNSIDSLKFPLKQPVEEETPHPNLKVTDGKACPSCLSLMYLLTSRLVGIRGDELRIVMGSQLNHDILKGNERVVALGGCAIRKLNEMNIKIDAKIEENMDAVEQLVLLKKLLTTKGAPKITTVDKVKSKMKSLFSKVIA